jgi:hypothetical protein
MNFRNASAVRRAIGPAVLVCAAVGACSNSTAVPRTFLSATFKAFYDPMHNNQNTCKQRNGGEVLGIGTASSDPMRVSDGQQDRGMDIVQVQCSVTGSYEVRASAYRPGASGGNLSISGHVDVSAGGQNITAELDLSGYTFQASDCNISFTYQNSAVPQNPPIAKGRIWGHLTCNKMIDGSGQLAMLMDGAQVHEACGLEADFIFENCST